MPICYGPRIERVPAMFKALANANRRSVLHMISSLPGITGAEMARNLGISQQAVSRHIIALTRAGLLGRPGWEGYWVDSGGIDELVRFIQRYFSPPDRSVRRAHWM